MFATRLIRARKAAGLSMNSLAAAVGVSANAIKKYEHGSNMPSSANLLKLAKALQVRTEYFFRPVKIELKGVEYRKQSDTPKKLLNQINGDVIDQAERWTELLDVYPDSVQPIPSFALPANLPQQLDNLEAVEAIAELMRHEWSLGLNPIHDMTDTLESKGVMIISTAVETSKKFNGLAGTLDTTPVVVISTHQPGDQQRFTLAHELGHLVLQNRLADHLDEEIACDHFAAAFLLPASALNQHLGTNRRALEAQELHLLKHEFGLPMLAILARAGHCKIITNSLQKHYATRYRKMGWRAQEPGTPYANETTFLYKQLVYRALSEDYIGESKAAEILGIPLSRFHKERKLEVLIASAANQ